MRPSAHELRHVPLRAVLAAIAIGALLTAAGLSRLRELERTAIVEWRSRVMVTAGLTREFLSGWLDDRYADAREVAAVVAARASRADARALEELSATVPARLRRRGYRGLTIVDRRGVVRGTDGPDSLLVSEIAAAQRVAATLTEAVLGPSVSDDGRARIAVISPIPAADAAVVLVYDAAIAVFPFLLSDGGRARTVRTKVIGREAGGLRVLTPSRYPQSEAQGRFVPLHQAPKLWVTMGLGRDTAGVFRDLANRQIVAAATAIPSAPWSVIRAIDHAEVVETAHERFRSECAIVVALALVGVTVSGAVWRDAYKRRIAAEKRERIAREHQRVLDASEARFRAVFHNAAVGIALCDETRTIHQTNPALDALLGYAPDELCGRSLVTIAPAGVTEQSDEQMRALMADVADGQRPTATMERRLLRHDGSEVWSLLTMSRLHARDASQGLVVMVQDITPAKELELQLTHRAFHDALTNLANRALLLDRIEHALRLEGRRGWGVAVLFIDLDQFKAVNDAHGHATGDKLLTVVAERLRRGARSSDTVARLSGDEFAVLLESVESETEAKAAAERALVAIGAPIEIAGKRFFARASAGVAMARGGETAADLLRFADLAMYRAKRRGKGCVDLFDASLTEDLVDRLDLEVELRQGVELGAFHLVYQPIVELLTGEVSGVEALVRWNHTTRGRVAPAAFIPVAEESGLIVPIGRWVLNEACRQGAAWNRARHNAGATPLTVSVNISGRQLQHDNFIDDVQLALAESGLQADRLLLEITESVIMSDVDATLTRLRALRDVGVRLAIDDFGTGYSSLSYLRQFPIQVLKIDKSFIDAIDHSTSGSALARTIIALGETLGLRTVAEGIEHEPQRSSLLGLGCGFGQGFLFAQPLEREELEVLLIGGPVVGAGSPP